MPAMKPAPLRDRRGLFAALYLAWGITLLCFVVSGRYRNFIKPSFVVFLWMALATLLVFAVAEAGQLGSAEVRVRDVVRSGFLMLPLLALWLAKGQILDSQAYLKRSITLWQHAGTKPGDVPMPSRRDAASRPDSAPAPLKPAVTLVRHADTSGARPVPSGKAMASRSDSAPAPLKAAVSTGQQAGKPADELILSGKEPAPRLNSISEPLRVTIQDILQNPKNFEGKWVETEGMVLSEETLRKDKSARKEAFVPGAFLLFRFSIICCVADSQPLGLIVEGSDQKNLVDNDWYRIVGRFAGKKDQLGTISQAVLSRLKTPPEAPYLYWNQNSQDQ